MERERRREKVHKKRKHRIDVRGTVPLFFRRYYFVILIGRDTRQETLRIEAERRYKVRKINNGISAFFLLMPFLLLLLLLAYYLKSALGINLMPVLHLQDLLDMFYRFLDRIFKLS
jgi:hypothetical protein